MTLSLPPVKPSFLKSVDRIIGSLAIRLTPPPLVRSFPVSDIRSILVIRPGGIGDAALLAPTIYTLQQRYPLAHIHILAEKRNGGTFSLIPGIARLRLYDTPTGLIETLRTRYDLVIDTEQWHRLSALIARLTRAPVLIGFDTNERRRMFTHTVPYSHDAYEADSFLHLVEPLGVEYRRDETEKFLFPPDDAQRLATRLLHNVGGDPFVTIFPGASIRERQWGSDRFRNVVRKLEENGLRSVIVGGPSDRSQAEDIVTGCSALNLAGCTTLAGTAAVIASSRLLLSGDSGVLHIGVGLGVPTVSLFGPGIASKWAPRGPRHMVLDRGLSCSPCTRFGTTPPCPRNVSCLSGIMPEEVADAILHMTESGERNSKKKDLDFIGIH